MKTIIYTPENEIENELSLITALMDAGADYLYIRKPALDDFLLVDYMEQFDEKYYPKIVTTSLIITKEFNLGGFHFTREAIKKNQVYNDKVRDWLKTNNKISSVSAHSLEEMKQYDGKFDHMIISPLFTSISKPSHHYDWNLEELKNYITHHSQSINSKSGRQLKSKFYAVGGMDETKVAEVIAMHFDGVGLLGALWRQPELAVAIFTRIKLLIGNEK